MRLEWFSPVFVAGVVALATEPGNSLVLKMVFWYDVTIAFEVVPAVFVC